MQSVMMIRAPLIATLVLLGVLLPREGLCLDLKPGQEVALAIDAAANAGSLASIIGNAITLKQKRPSRGWLVSGYVFGAINIVTSPILLVYGRDPEPGLGIGLGIVHGVLGITNMALALYGGVLWRRLRIAEGAVRF